MAFYSKCFVLGSRIKVKYAVSGNGAAGIPTSTQVVGLTITTDTTGLSDITTSVSGGLCDYHVHNVNPDAHKLEMSVDIAKFVDKPIILDDPQFFCTSSANPSQVVVAQLWAIAPNAVATNSICTVVEVEFDCIFTDPIPFT